MVSHDLTVVHLSDLHFRDGAYRRVFHKLISDIKAQLVQDKDVVIVVTGDLVTKGNVCTNKENVVSFFNELMSELPSGINLLDLEIVPRNHDGRRGDDIFTWESKGYLLDMGEFESLVGEIYEVTRKRFPWVASKKFNGLTEIMFHDRRIAFCRLDTSSYEVSTHRRKIVDDLLADHSVRQVYVADNVVREFNKSFAQHFTKQLHDSGAQYHALCRNNGGREPDLTVVLTHHPFSLLSLDEYDTFEDALFKNNFEIGDVFLAGHTHTGNHGLTSHNAQHKIMLNTGLGWHESPDDLLRYSIYRMNLDRNTCNVSIRSSSANEDFRSDASTGTSIEFSQRNTVTLPLKTRTVGAAIFANTASVNHCFGIYLDARVANRIKEFIGEMRWTRLRINQKIDGYERLAEEEYKNLSFAEALWLLLRRCRAKLRPSRLEIKYIVVREHYFRDFIKEITLELSQMLANLSLPPVLEDKRDAGVSLQSALGIEWRVHVRRYMGKNEKKIKPKNDEYRATHAFGLEGEDLAIKPRPIRWGGLIEYGYRGDGCLINSANPGINKIGTEWSDFITIMPKEQRLIKKFGRAECRPLLTFGISFKSADFMHLSVATKTLYLLEYLGIQSLVEDSFVYFMDKYSFNSADVISEMP